MSKPKQKNSPQSRPSSDKPGSGQPEASRSGAASKERTEIKRKQNADRRKFANSASCDAARASQSAHACPAFHCGSRQRGLLVPKAQRQAMLPETWPERSILYGRPNRGAETLRLSTGVTRAAPVPVQRAPRAPVIVPAGMMPKPPESDGDEPPPAGTALAPPDEVTGRRPLRERDAPPLPFAGPLSSLVTGVVTRVLISRRFFASAAWPWRRVRRSSWCKSKIMIA